ncbi:MAG TPA: hypothetical protein PKY82_25180 [Pyrinomonadaceae bacterium]|nr:hypothetical protein [Pyrinomonadaceae bacterium]
MQSIFENIGKPTKRNYLSAFVSFLMPLIWIFLPQLFEPLEMIKSYIFGATPPNANYFTLADVALLSYFGTGILLGAIAIGLQNKTITTITFATLGILMHLFFLAGTCFEIKMRTSNLQF